MKVYHGSYTEILTVDLSKCEPYRDFGKVFYVTKLKKNKQNFGQIEKEYIIKTKE